MYMHPQINKLVVRVYGNTCILRIFVHNSLKGTGHLFVSALTCDFKLYVSDYQVLAYFTHMTGKLFAVYVSPKNIM